MKIELILKTLNVSAIIIATPLLFLSLWGFLLFLSNLSLSKTPVFISFLLGIMGYVGLIMSLMKHKSKKRYNLNVFLLFAGIAAPLLFILTGGERAIEWIIYLEEPDEAFLLLYPMVISIVLISNKLTRLSTIANLND